MLTIWKRLNAGEALYATRARQLADTDRALEAAGGIPPTREPGYSPIELGSRAKLAAADARRSERSVELVRRTVEALRAEGLPVDRAGVVARSKTIDDASRGVSLSVLYQNVACSALINSKARPEVADVAGVPSSIRKMGRRKAASLVGLVENAVAEATEQLAAACEELLHASVPRLRERAESQATKITPPTSSLDRPGSGRPPRSGRRPRARP